MNDYLSKPFEENDLIQVVCRWLDRSKDTVTSFNKNNNQGKLYDLSKLEGIAKGNQEFVDKMIQLFISQTRLSVFQYNKYNFQKMEYFILIGKYVIKHNYN